jgi:hypothetical protein
VPRQGPPHAWESRGSSLAPVGAAWHCYHSLECSPRSPCCFCPCCCCIRASAGAAAGRNVLEMPLTTACACTLEHVRACGLAWLERGKCELRGGNWLPFQCERLRRPHIGHPKEADHTKPIRGVDRGRPLAMAAVVPACGRPLALWYPIEFTAGIGS